MLSDPNFIKNWVSTFLGKLTNELSATIEGNGLPGNLRDGVWIEREETIFGYISYTPHRDPNEESLEITLTIKFLKGAITIAIDIGWSDGEIIEEVSQNQVSYHSNSELTPKLESLSETIYARLLSDMMKYIQVDRPPRYRSD